MIRLTLVIAVSVSMATLAYTYFEDIPNHSAALTSEQIAKRRIDADWQRMDQFRKTLDQCLVDLADEELTLTQAVDRIEEAANSYYPIYLKMLEFPKRSASTRERIAHNLFRHFVVEMGEAVGDTAQLNKTLCRLRVELAQLFPPVAATASRD